jgi:predicted permease
MNAASLFLGRGERRRGEIALRTALGAGRVRVASQLLAESVLVAGLAGALGVALAHGGVTLLRWLAPPGLPRLDGVAVDVRVLAVGLGTALATGLVFGLVPVVPAWRSDVRDVLASAGWGGIGSRGGGRFRRGLVVVQLSLATALVLGAGLLLRSFRELRRVDLGFEPEGVLVMPLAPAVTNVAPDGDAIAFYQALERRIAGLPGVAAVGSAYRIPLADGHDNYSIRVEDRPAATLGDAPSPGMQWATPGYFGALGIPLRHGRLFTAADDADAPLVAVVNERLARELWPGEDAVGKRLRMWPEGSAWMEVVGVVADVKHYGVREDASTKLYVPHLQGYRGAYHSPNRMALFVRTEADPAALAGPVRAVVREVGPDVPIGRVRPMADIAGEALARERFTLALLGLFALVALLLAAVGVYGVVALAVVARTREIGLRMAVGADRGRVAGRVLREGLVLAAWGLVFGLAGGFLAARLLRATLFGVGPADPWTYAAAAPLLAAVVALASFLPALGAARMDPVRALRAD